MGNHLNQHGNLTGCRAVGQIFVFLFEIFKKITVIGEVSYGRQFERVNGHAIYLGDIFLGDNGNLHYVGFVEKLRNRNFFL